MQAHEELAPHPSRPDPGPPVTAVLPAPAQSPSHGSTRAASYRLRACTASAPPAHERHAETRIDAGYRRGMEDRCARKGAKADSPAGAHVNDQGTSSTRASDEAASAVRKGVGRAAGKAECTRSRQQ